MKAFFKKKITLLESIFIYEFVPVAIVAALFREPETETSVGNSTNYLKSQS
jgi:hypothetical protein